MRFAILYSVFILISLVVLYPHCSACKEIEIGLITSSEKIKIGSSTKATLINLYNNNVITKIKEKEACTVHNVNGLISIVHLPSNTSLGVYTGPVKLIAENKNGLVFCNKNWYKGELTLLTNGSTTQTTVVNKLDVEDYLLSVVPSEIPSNWNIEVLKSQSIAARSYALGYLGRRKDKGYDLESTVEDQVYLGVISEKEQTSKAVKETRGLILLDKFNKPLIALYHSSGGGYTDSIENLWEMKGSPHIRPRPDYDDKSPHFKWYKKYDLNQVSAMLNHLNVGNILNITPLFRSISQRIMRIEIKGSNKSIKLRGEDFRRLIKLPSSKFNLLIENNNVYFAGRGFGHGLGLSQWGAKALAEAGFKHNEILVHYYPGTRLVNIEN